MSQGAGSGDRVRGTLGIRLAPRRGPGCVESGLGAGLESRAHGRGALCRRGAIGTGSLGAADSECPLATIRD